MNTNGMKVACVAVLCSVCSVWADLTVRVTDEGKFDSQGLKPATRVKQDFRFERFAGRMAAVYNQPYVLVNYAQAEKLRPATEAAKWEYVVEIEYFDGTNTAADVKAAKAHPKEAGKPRCLFFKYDSADESHNPKSYMPGAWRCAGLVELTGSGTWKKTTLRLPWARFDRKGLNEFDFRIDPDGRSWGSTWGIGAMRVFVQLKQEEVVDPKTLTVLENDKLRLEFDGLRVRRIHDKTRKIDVVKAASIVHPILALQMLVKEKGVKKLVRETAAVAKRGEVKVNGEGEEKTLTMSYTFDNGVVAKPQARLTAKGEIEWTIAITCPEGVEVCGIDYPMLSGVAIAGDPNDDLYYGGATWRQVWAHAYRRSGGMKPQGSATRFMAMWDEHAAVYLGLEDPGQNDWRFFDCGDAAGAARMGVRLSMRAKSGEIWNGEKKVEKVGGGEGGGGGVVWRMAVTDGGTWHKAASIARAYNKTHLHGPTVPNYVKWLADAWIYPNSNEFPRQGWDTLNNNDADNSCPRSFGTNDTWYAEPAIAWGNRQMIDGPCGAYCGRYPYPSLVWGSLEEFRQKMDLNRSLGGFYTPYFNFNLFSPGYIRHKRLGAYAKSLLPEEARTQIPSEDWFYKVSQQNFNGASPTNQLDSWFGEFDQCIITPEWRQWTLDWMKRYAEWGADGMYYDQLNMAYGNSRICPGYEDSYGSWLKASRDTVALVNRETRKINPYAHYSGEVANEIIAQELDISMTSGVFDHHEIFRYVNPWAIVFDGKANGGRQENKYRFNWQSGARFDQGMKDHMDYLALRKRIKSILYDAEFRDGEDLVLRRDGVEVPERYKVYEKWDLLYPLNDGLTAKWFVFKEEGKSKSEEVGGGRAIVVNVINVLEEKKADKWGNTSVVKSTVGKNATVTVPTAEIGEVKAAWAFTLDGRVEKVEVGGLGLQRMENSAVDLRHRTRPSVTVSVPDEEAVSIILSNGRMRPLVAWEHDPVQTGGSKGKVLLKVTNVNDQPMNVSVKLRLPEGWTMGKVEVGGLGLQRMVQILPGETKEVLAEYVVVKNASLGRYDIWADVTAETGTFSAYNYAVVNEPLLMDLRGVRGEYHVWFRNLTDEPIKGTLAMSAKEGLVAAVAGRPPYRTTESVRPSCQAGESTDVTIPPMSVLRVPVEVTGVDALMEGSEITATFKTGVWPFQKKTVRHKAVFPLLPNRNFEIDHAGDGKPDWWMCRQGMDWTYECMNLSTNAHSGKYALELKPWKRFGKGVWANPTFFDAKMGATYKFSCWTKAPKGGTVLFAGYFIHLPKSEGWVKTEKTFKVNEIRWNYFQIQLGDGPMLIDDIEIEEVKGAKGK